MKLNNPFFIPGYCSRGFFLWQREPLSMCSVMDTMWLGKQGTIKDDFPEVAKEFDD